MGVSARNAPGRTEPWFEVVVGGQLQAQRLAVQLRVALQAANPNHRRE